MKPALVKQCHVLCSGADKDEAQMLDFVEKEILAFKYLIEYQFLKKRFFSVVSQQFN